MAINRAELLRLISHVVGPDRSLTVGNEIRISDGDQTVVITCKPGPPRRIAGICIERSEVILSFHGMDETAQANFLKRFDNVYRRGGG